jgi:hypothetical protein
MDSPVDRLVFLSCSVKLVVGLVEGAELMLPVTQVSSLLHMCLSVSCVDAGSSISSLWHSFLQGVNQYMKYFTFVNHLACFMLCLIFNFL